MTVKQPAKRAKGMHLLTPREVQTATRDVSDGGGLAIRFARNGKGSPTPYWVFRFSSPTVFAVDTAAGEAVDAPKAVAKRRELGLGPVAQSSIGAAGRSLTEAREEAAKARALLREKIDPIEKDKADREAAEQEAKRKKNEAKLEHLTLRRHAHAYIDKIEGTFRNRKHEQQWGTTVLKLLPEKLLDTPVAEIRPTQLLEALVPICKRTPETGRRLAQRVRVLFDAAVVEELRDDNPMLPIRGELARRAGKRKPGHFAALNYRDLPAFIERLRQVEGVSARALEFQLFTACRPGEVLNAEWCEFNLDRREWVIPAHRMKREEEHLVFLSESAVALVESMKGLSEKYVFPAPRTGGPMAIDALRMVMRRMGESAATPHGTARRCFKTAAKELGLAPKDVIECALAHREKDRTEAAYDMAEFIAERRRLLQVWGEYLEGRWKIPDNVVDFRAVRAAA